MPSNEHSDVPVLPGFDHTLTALRVGYPFIARCARQFHSDVFGGRVLGERVLFLTGAEGARLFYDEARFRRAGAAPKLVLKTLFGEGGVQGLDDQAHRHRKAAFMAMMTKGQIARFLELAQSEWNAASSRWESAARIVLLDEAHETMCRAACAWAGVPLQNGEARELAHDCAAMVAGFTGIGPRMWRGRAARLRRERWAGRLIERARRGELAAGAGSALRVFAEHRELDGSPLPAHIAAVELLNIIRPITAIGRWVAFLALALRDHPHYLERLATDEALVDAFVQEVRRYYPFTPLLGARVRHGFSWRGVPFAEGQLVVLDVWGTLHDPRLWEQPDEFRPERFLGREPGAFDLIPHGGGDFLGGHRCAGEWLTIEAMKQALRLLTRHLRYEFPAQDLGYSLRELLPIPQSGVVLRNVARSEPPASAFDPAGLRGSNGLTASARS